jgi:hypothetical protein
MSSSAVGCPTQESRTKPQFPTLLKVRGSSARLPRTSLVGEASPVSTSPKVDASRQGNRSAAALRPRRLVGREREIAEVTESILSAAVTTLVGPGLPRSGGQSYEAFVDR